MGILLLTLPQSGLSSSLNWIARPFISNLAISSNAITITNSYHHLSPNGGTLNTINGGSNGSLLLLDNQSGNTITVNSLGTGSTNISLNGNVFFTLQNNNKLFSLYGIQTIYKSS